MYLTTSTALVLLLSSLAPLNLAAPVPYLQRSALNAVDLRAFAAANSSHPTDSHTASIFDPASASLGILPALPPPAFVAAANITGEAATSSAIWRRGVVLGQPLLSDDDGNGPSSGQVVASPGTSTFTAPQQDDEPSAPLATGHAINSQSLVSVAAAPASPTSTTPPLPLNGLFTPSAHLFPLGLGLAIAAAVAFCLILLALLKCLLGRRPPAHEDVYTVGVAAPPRRRSKLRVKGSGVGVGLGEMEELGYEEKVGEWEARSGGSCGAASWDSHYSSADSYAYLQQQACHSRAHTSLPWDTPTAANPAFTPLPRVSVPSPPPVQPAAHPAYPLTLSQVMPPLPPAAAIAPTRVVGRAHTIMGVRPLVESPRVMSRASTVAGARGVLAAAGRR